MSKEFQEIARDASRLSREQRFDLVGLLLDLNESSADAEVSPAWEREILARIQAVDGNNTEGISFEKVMRDAEDRLTS